MLSEMLVAAVTKAYLYCHKCVYLLYSHTRETLVSVNTAGLLCWLGAMLLHCCHMCIITVIAK